MNRSYNTKLFFKEVLKCLGLATLGLIGLFCFLAYLLFKIPNFENFYSYFPMVLLFAEGAFLAMLSKFFSQSSILFVITCAVIISIFSILIGALVYGITAYFSRLILFHFAFIAETSALHFLFKNKITFKKKGKKLPFAK